MADLVERVDELTHHNRQLASELTIAYSGGLPDAGPSCRGRGIIADGFVFVVVV